MVLGKTILFHSERCSERPLSNESQAKHYYSTCVLWCASENHPYISFLWIWHTQIFEPFCDFGSLSNHSCEWIPGEYHRSAFPENWHFLFDWKKTLEEEDWKKILRFLSHYVNLKSTKQVSHPGSKHHPFGSRLGWAHIVCPTNYVMFL